MSFANSSSGNTAPIYGPDEDHSGQAGEGGSSLKQRLDSAVYSIKSIISGRWFGREKGPVGVVESFGPERDLFRVAAERVHGSAEPRDDATPPAPFGYFQGRPIIGERTRINGGIYVGVRAQEALVVDDRYGLLKRMFSKSCGRCIVIREHKKNYEYEIFAEISNAARRAMAYSSEGVQSIARIEKLQPDQKISLDVYIENGVGVSRHRVLLAAYLLEKLKDMGVIDGHAAVERHDIDGEERELLVYATPGGQVYEFDPVEKPKLIKAERC